MRFCFIVNPKAGSATAKDNVTPIIETTFSKTHHQYDLRLTHFRGHATTLADAAVREGYDVVVAVGGDGTVNEVGTALVGSEAAMGIIPAGSGNGLARELGIPLSMPRACQALIEGRTREIDVGVANGRYFFMAAGVGFDALVTKRYNERSSSRRGMLPYFCVAVREALDFQPERTVLRIDSQELILAPFMVTVANARQLGGSAIIAPRARIDDGLFDVCVVRNLTVPQFFCQAPRLFNGQIEKVPQLDIWRTDRLEIEREKPSPMQVDGEPFQGARRLSISLLPQALKVRVGPITGEVKASSPRFPPGPSVMNVGVAFMRPEPPGLDKSSPYNTIFGKDISDAVGS